MRRYSRKRRRLMYLGEKISRLDVFERDNWTCHICRRKIDKTLRLPHPLAATLDHILPLCRGGQHVYSNVAAAHAYCNFTKSDRIDFDLESLSG